MKYFNILFVLLFCQGLLKAQLIGNSVFFATPEIGYVAGVDWTNPDVTVIKTTNGGNAWSIQSGISNSLCYDCYFLDSLIGYCVGEDTENGGGLILKTTDGGDNWERRINGSASSFKSVYFINASTGYVVGYDYFDKYRIIKTTDGGISWLDQYCQSTVSLNSVYFTNVQTGYIVGDNGEIFKTTNAGNQWTSQSSGITNDLNDVNFNDSTHGFIAGDNGIILSTADGGIHWIIQNSGVPGNLNSIFFTDNTKGFIVGDIGIILTTSNSGIEWTLHPVGITADLYSVHFADELNGFVSSVSSILRTTDGGLTWIKKDINVVTLISPNGGEELYSLENYSIVWGTYMLNSIKIEFSQDGGTSWDTIVDSIPVSQTYEWIPGNSDSLRNCLIKITDTSDSSIYDISDNYFSLIPSGIYLESPNGGEIWDIGNTEKINWTSAGNFPSITIKLSTNNGLNWTFIALFIPDSGSYSWIVESSAASSECLVKVYQNGGYGLYDISDNVFTIDYPNTADENTGNDLPRDFMLYQNFPNPFNPSTKINYELPVNSMVTLIIYNTLGEEIHTLVHEYQSAGKHSSFFIINSSLPSGVYFYKLKAVDPSTGSRNGQAGQSFLSTKKMILLR